MRLDRWQRVRLAAIVALGSALAMVIAAVLAKLVAHLTGDCQLWSREAANYCTRGDGWARLVTGGVVIIAWVGGIVIIAGALVVMALFTLLDVVVGSLRRSDGTL